MTKLIQSFLRMNHKESNLLQINSFIYIHIFPLTLKLHCETGLKVFLGVHTSVECNSLPVFFHSISKLSIRVIESQSSDNTSQ